MCNLLLALCDILDVFRHRRVSDESSTSVYYSMPRNTAGERSSPSVRQRETSSDA